MKPTKTDIKPVPVDPEFCRLHDLLLAKNYRPRPYSVKTFISEHTSYELDLEARLSLSGQVEDILISKPH